MNRILIFAVAMVCCSATLAQNFPTRPVTLVVPFPAGGPTDTIARIMAERMTKSLGQTVVVENVTGAGGNIGVSRVVRAASEGYMVSIGHTAQSLDVRFWPKAVIRRESQIRVSACVGTTDQEA